MSSEETAEEEEKDGGGGTPWLLVIIAAVVSLAIGAGGAFLVMPKPEPIPMPEQDAAVAGEPMMGGEEFRERLYSLEPFVVNVTGDGYNRFLKVKIEVEAESPELKGELDARLSQVRDALIVLLSSKRLSDITDYEGKALLKEDILDRINDVLETGEASSVLFTEFVVQ